MTTGDWSVTVAPYIWATSLDGEVAAGPLEADVDVPFRDILEDLSFAFMAYTDVRKGRFGLFVNPTIARTEDEVSLGPADIDVTNESILLAAGAFYRVAEWRIGTMGSGTPRVIALEPLAGVRWSYLRLELDLEGGPERDESESWLDPIIGARVFADLGDRWLATFEADIGGFGVGSDLAWNVQGYLAYRTSVFGQPTTLGVGYRALHQDFDNDGFVYDVTQHGPIIGAAFRF